MEKDCTEKLLEQHIRGLEAQIESISHDASMYHLCTSFLNDAVSGLSHLKNATSSDTHPQIDSLALSFASLATCLTSHFTWQIAVIEERKGRDARIKKGIHDVAVSVAQSIAFKAWEADSEHKIQIGEMCVNTWASMIDIGYRDDLPNDAEGLRKWIAPIAPKYARLPGRPRKT